MERRTKDDADPEEDLPLSSILSYLKQAWRRADPEERAWIRIQFRKAFPESEEVITREVARRKD